MNYKLTKEQITNCIEYLRKDNNQTPITSNSIAYNLFFYKCYELILHHYLLFNTKAVYLILLKL